MGSTAPGNQIDCLRAHNGGFLSRRDCRVNAVSGFAGRLFLRRCRGHHAYLLFGILHHPAGTWHHGRKKAHVLAHSSQRDGIRHWYCIDWLGEYLLVSSCVGIGVAALQPASASRAREVSCGNFGFALGPVIVAITMGIFGLGATPLLVIPALIGTAAVLVLNRYGAAKPAKKGNVT